MLRAAERLAAEGEIGQRRGERRSDPAVTFPPAPDPDPPAPVLVLGAHQNVQRLRLLQRIDRVVADVR